MQLYFSLPTTHLATMAHAELMIILKEPRLTPPLCCKKLQSTISSGNELQVSPILRVQPSFATSLFPRCH